MTDYNPMIEDANCLIARVSNVADWRLLRAQLIAESMLNPDAVSSAGAQGIAQFMPATWQDMVDRGIVPAGSTPFDAEHAIKAAGYYMGELISWWTAPRPEMDRYLLALASYNAGFGNMLQAQRNAGGFNDYARIISGLDLVTGRNALETKGYVLRIMRYYTRMVISGHML